MSPKDREYYRGRARVERLCAAKATDPVAVEIHKELACMYEKLVALEEEERRARTFEPTRLWA